MGQLRASPFCLRFFSCFSVGVPLAFALLVSSEALSAGAHLAYYGGRVVSHPAVVSVSWGPNVDATVASGMPGFYASILQSPYLDWLSEYSTVGLLGLLDNQPGSSQRIGRGSFVGADSYLITPTLTGTALSNTQVLAELAAQIAAGHLPAPQLDAAGNANTVYMVNFPPGVTLLSYGGAQSCGPSQSGFCGTTDTLVVNGHSVGVGLVLDESTDAGCAAQCGTDSSYFNNVTQVHAHQLLNLVTNLESGLWSEGTGTVGRPLAWYSLGGTAHQAADICAGQSALVEGYTVALGWSNAQGACVSGPDGGLPVCTAASTYCRQCSTADVGVVDGGCTGATAACETDGTNPSFGECVGCTQDEGCSGTTPVCAKGGAANDTCRACSGDAECTNNPAGAHCLSSGACGPEPAATAKGGGCSSTGSPAVALSALLAVGALLLRRRLVPGVRPRWAARRPRQAPDVSAALGERNSRGGC